MRAMRGQLYLARDFGVDVILHALLTQNNEEVKVVQEFPRHANSSHHVGSLRSGGYAEQAAGTKQTGSDVFNKGERSTGLTKPNWTKTEIANSLPVLERIGGDDGTRTRGLCRDSSARIGFTTTYRPAGTAKIR